MRKLLTCFAVMALVAPACAERHEPPVTAGRDIRLSILHTTDIHSRLLPYDMQVLAGDRDLGLHPDHGPFGGIARMAHIIQRERARAARSIYVDSGDCFQGAPIFNAFLGEAEQRALSQLRPDAVVIGNHEFDEGINNYVAQLKQWATYPVVAANYLFEPGNPLGEIAKPVEIINADGLKIGIIGIANFSSITSITEVGNSLGIIPLEITRIVQDWIDILEPHVDLIVAVSHAGLTEDERIIQQTRGLDIIMGGHLHIVLAPPKVVKDLDGRDVILAHSGAFAKFVGKLDVVVRDGDVIAHDYEVFPIDSRVPEDPQMLQLIEPYRLELHQLIDLQSVYGYASKLIRRFGFDGGDSPLGNLVAEAIRQYARADFAMTNSLGIRTDLNPGAVTLDQLYNIFPFNNYVTTMYLSGADIQELLDFVTLRSAGRGCATQVQVSGIEFVMDCRSAPADCTKDCPPRATDIFFTDCGDPTVVDKTGCARIPLDHDAVYEMATNDYIARGGSGFTVLQINNTQVITDVALRDAVLERVIRSPMCVEDCRRADGSLLLEGCVAYESCVGEVADFYARRCEGATDTAPQRLDPVSFCGVDLGGSCAATMDCYAHDGCTAETCTPCKNTAQCAAAGEGLACVGGFCRPEGVACVSRRCQRTCAVDADCPGAALAEATGQAVCVGGVCQPRPGAPCDDDRACVDAELVCAGDRCSPCQGSWDCGDGELCVDGACVVSLAICADHRCRTRCEADAECMPGEVCAEPGLCVPATCVGGQDPQTACEIYGAWRAAERCLTVPCPSAESDGRIGRILPENLEELPTDGNPDDPL